MSEAHTLTVSESGYNSERGRSIIWLLPFFLTILFALAGCSKDKDIDQEDLYGRWKASDGYYYTFNEDLTGSTSDEDGDSFDFTWKLSDKELTLRIMGNGSTDKVVYQRYDIKSLKDNKMVCVDVNEPGIDITFTRQ